MKKKIRKLVLAAAFCGFLAFFLPIAGAALSRKPSLDSETHSINTGQINRPESSMSISESPSGPDIEAEEVDLDRIESVSETDTEKTEETVVPSAQTGDDAPVLFFCLFFISGACLIVLKKAKRGFFMDELKSVQFSSVSGTDLMQRMSKIYEERDREYEQLSAQYQQREDVLEKITKTLESQKQRQDAKEKNLTELEEKLQTIKVSLEDRTAVLQEKEAELLQKEEDSKKTIKKEYQKLQENIEAAEAQRQIERNEIRNQKLALERERGEVRAMKQQVYFGVSESDTEELEQELTKCREQANRLQEELQEKEEEIFKIKSERAAMIQPEHSYSEEDMENMKKQIQEIQKEKGEQLKKIIDLTSELNRLKEEKQDGKTEEVPDRLSPEQMEEYLKAQKDFSNVYTLHMEDGEIVTSLRGNIHFRFVFKAVPFFDLCVQREETEQLKETIYELNMRYNYKFLYDRDRSEAVLSCTYLPDVTCEELMYQALEAAQCIAAE